MGNNLRGRPLGKGITQLKDGRFYARYTNNDGKRKGKYFTGQLEASDWLAKELIKKENYTKRGKDDITLEALYEYWITNVKKDSIRRNTIRIYADRWKNNIKEHIGSKYLREITPFDCEKVIMAMRDANYANSTMDHTRLLLQMLFCYAIDKEILERNPLKKSHYQIKGVIREKKRALTIEEQKKFLEVIKNNPRYKYNQFMFLLQTGLRIGEMNALTWDDIDFEKRTLSVNKTMEYKEKNVGWISGLPKTKSSVRTIQLTETAINILKDQMTKNSQIEIKDVNYSKYVFLGKKGEPIKNSTYDGELGRIAKKAGIPPLSTHSLRHTFATRCAEAGMQSQVLQRILGHSDIKTTLNIYVTVTNEHLKEQMNDIEKYLTM